MSSILLLMVVNLVMCIVVPKTYLASRYVVTYLGVFNMQSCIELFQHLIFKFQGILVWLLKLPAVATYKDTICEIVKKLLNLT